MNTSKSTWIGIICAIGWCIFSSVSRVFTGSLTQEIEPYTLCFYVFLVSAIIFNLANLKNTLIIINNIIFQKTIRNKFIWINITTFGAWFLLLYPLKYIEPAIVSTITLGVGPLSTLIINRFLSIQTKMVSKIDLIISLFLIIIIIYIISLIVFNHELIRKDTSLYIVLYAIINCLVAGFSIAAQNICTKKVSNAGFSPQQILSVRFWLIIIISGIIIKFMGIQSLNYLQIQYIIVLSLCMVVIPLYLVQVSIKHIDPLMFAVIALFMPICTFLLEFLDNKLQPSLISAIPIIANCIILLVGFLIQYNRSRYIRNKVNNTGN